jgi:hypothetical protein
VTPPVGAPLANGTSARSTRGDEERPAPPSAGRWAASGTRPPFAGSTARAATAAPGLAGAAGAPADEPGAPSADGATDGTKARSRGASAAVVTRRAVVSDAATEPGLVSRRPSPLLGFCSERAAMSAG